MLYLTSKTIRFFQVAGLNRRASASINTRFRPYNIITWLPVSTTEWIASENIAELPVRAAATNLVIATIRLPIRAAMMTFLDSAALIFRFIHRPYYCFVAVKEQDTVPGMPLHVTDCELSVADIFPVVSIVP